MNLTIGKRLLQLRKKKNYSQQDLATQLGVTRQTISKWEQDLSLPDLDMLSSISEIFEVSITTLLGVENQEESITEIYDQMQAVLKNMQKTNHSRNILLIILIGICIISLSLIVSLKLQLTKETGRNDIENSYKTQFILEDSVGPYTFSTTIEEFCILDGLENKITRFDVGSFNLEECTVTLDYHIVLKKYSPNTKISINFDDGGVFDYPLSFSFTKISDNEFVLQETIPLYDYDEVTITFEGLDENVIVEKLSYADYLTNALKSQIWLFLPYENGKLGLDKISFRPDFSHSEENFNGRLKGYLTIRFLDENKRLLCDRVNIDLSKEKTYVLSKSLPINQQIYFQLEYSLIPSHDIFRTSGSFGVLTQENSYPYSYFNINDTSQQYDLCFYRKY